MKKILITGKNSFIGASLERYLKKEPDKYEVESISVKGEAWKDKDFSQYDIIFHVAAIVHKKEKLNMNEHYLKVNYDLPIEIAKKAKNEGISQYIFMSTMAVYGLEGSIKEKQIVNTQTTLNPKSLYAISKVKAEKALIKKNSEKFKVVILRPPMVYGPNCPGNYAKLEKLAVKLPIFPMIDNERSVLHINKLCEIVKECIDSNSEGLFLPQDEMYINTSLLVKELAIKNGSSIYLSKTLGWIVKIVGRENVLVKKIFGNLVYEKH